MTTLHEEQIPITNRKHSLDFDRISDIIEEDKNYENADDEIDRKNGFSDYENPSHVSNRNNLFNEIFRCSDHVFCYRPVYFVRGIK